MNDRAATPTPTSMPTLPGALAPEAATAHVPIQLEYRPPETSLTRAARWTRRIVLALLVSGIVWAALWMMFSVTGARIRDDPRAFGADVRHWVRDHPVSAPAMYIGV